MTRQESIDHYRAREAEERRASRAAASAAAREAHFQLAERYADRAWSLEEEDAEQPLRSGSRR